MPKILLHAIATASLLVTGQAMAITLNAGQSAVFNFSAPIVSSTELILQGFVGGQTMTGSTAYYSGANLSGGLIYTDTDPASTSLSDSRTDSALLDGFSIRISVVSGTFTIDPAAYFTNSASSSSGVYVNGTSGFDSTAPASTPSVPEPSSLLLVVLAGLALRATRRRPAAD